jgi:hypothetical protein
MTEPKFRCGTKIAIEKLAKELNILIEDWMQDWPYEVANPNEIDKYIDYYQTITNEDEKFVLMEAIIQATEDQDKSELFSKYCNIIQYFLKEDFHIHEYTIHYWSCFDTENIKDCWKISPLMRELFIYKQNLCNSEPLNLKKTYL